MKVSICNSGKRFFFTNQGLKVGDDVWVLTSGYIDDDYKFYVCGVWTKNYKPESAQTILSLELSGDIPYRIITNKGFGHASQYFRQINATKSLYESFRMMREFEESKEYGE